MFQRPTIVEGLRKAEILNEDGLDLSKISEPSSKSDNYDIFMRLGVALAYEVVERYNRTYRADPDGHWLFECDEDWIAEVAYFAQTILREWSNLDLAWLPETKLNPPPGCPARAGSTKQVHTSWSMTDYHAWAAYKFWLYQYGSVPSRDDIDSGSGLRRKYGWPHLPKEMASLDYCPWVPTFVEDPIKYEQALKAAREEYAPPILPARHPRPDEEDEETREQMRQDDELRSLKAARWRKMILENDLPGSLYHPHKDGSHYLAHQDQASMSRSSSGSVAYNSSTGTPKLSGSPHSSTKSGHPAFRNSSTPVTPERPLKVSASQSSPLREGKHSSRLGDLHEEEHLPNIQHLDL